MVFLTAFETPPLSVNCGVNPVVAHIELKACLPVRRNNGLIRPLRNRLLFTRMKCPFDQIDGGPLRQTTTGTQVKQLAPEHRQWLVVARGPKTNRGETQIGGYEKYGGNAGWLILVKPAAGQTEGLGFSVCWSSESRPRVDDAGARSCRQHVRAESPDVSNVKCSLWILAADKHGDSGSPRVAGSTSPSMAWTSSGSKVVNALRPPPGLRTCPGSIYRPDSKCSVPRRIVVCANRVARATAATPPRPIAWASVAAHSRRCRSSSADASSWYFLRIMLTRVRSITQIAGPQHAIVAFIHCHSLSTWKSLASPPAPGTRPTWLPSRLVGSWYSAVPATSTTAP